jgi:hypothetical protein
MFDVIVVMNYEWSNKWEDIYIKVPSHNLKLHFYIILLLKDITVFKLNFTIARFWEKLKGPDPGIGISPF